MTSILKDENAASYYLFDVAQTRITLTILGLTGLAISFVIGGFARANPGWLPILMTVCVSVTALTALFVRDSWVRPVANLAASLFIAAFTFLIFLNGLLPVPFGLLLNVFALSMLHQRLALCFSAWILAVPLIYAGISPDALTLLETRVLLANVAIGSILAFVFSQHLKITELYRLTSDSLAVANEEQKNRMIAKKKCSPSLDMNYARLWRPWLWWLMITTHRTSQLVSR